MEMTLEPARPALPPAYNFGTELTTGTLTSTIRYYIVGTKPAMTLPAWVLAPTHTGVEFDSHRNGSNLDKREVAWLLPQFSPLKVSLILFSQTHSDTLDLR